MSVSNEEYYNRYPLKLKIWLCIFYFMQKIY